MKKILFPATNRVHLARQQILLDELRKHFEVDVLEYQSPNKDMLNVVADIANHYRPVMDYTSYYDLVLARGDRFEMLPIVMLAAYRGLKIAHLEGGDLSGAIDNKVRKAITALSDVHFATNKESFARLIQMGTDPDWTFNFGSLDVEYAKSIEVGSRKDYTVVCYHPMPGDNPEDIEEAIRELYHGSLDVKIIKSNRDNGESYGTEEYSSDEYIKLIAEAGCLVGNSSSFLKEASIFGTPVVNIGDRQKNRLKSPNVMDVPFDYEKIKWAVAEQLMQKYEPSEIYFKEETSKNICRKIKEYLD